MVRKKASQHIQKLSVSVEEAAQLLGLGRNTTYDLIATNRLHAVRVGRRLIIPRHELEAFLERESTGEAQ